MTYIFSGIFSEQELEAPYPEDSESLVLKKIKHRQLKSGALFANQAEDQIDHPNQNTFDLISQLKNFGVSKGFWIYYCCWGGDIDCVASAAIDNSKIDMNSYSLSDNMSYENLSDLFKKFNINIEKNGHFEPFVRNYWGMHGY